MTDLVVRLRAETVWEVPAEDLMREAADEIEQLHAAYTDLANKAELFWCYVAGHHSQVLAERQELAQPLRKAIALALKDEPQVDGLQDNSTAPR